MGSYCLHRFGVILSLGSYCLWGHIVSGVILSWHHSKLFIINCNLLTNHSVKPVRQARNPLVPVFTFLVWRVRGSNPRPPAPKVDALSLGNWGPVYFNFSSIKFHQSEIISQNRFRIYWNSMFIANTWQSIFNY